MWLQGSWRRVLGQVACWSHMSVRYGRNKHTHRSFSGVGSVDDTLGRTKWFRVNSLNIALKAQRGVCLSFKWKSSVSRRSTRNMIAYCYSEVLNTLCKDSSELLKSPLVWAEETLPALTAGGRGQAVTHSFPFCCTLGEQLTAKHTNNAAFSGLKLLSCSSTSTEKLATKTLWGM